MSEKEYIERKAVMEEIESLSVMVTGLWLRENVLTKYAKHYKCGVVKVLADAPAADVVPRSAYDQIRWERDVAMQQLSDAGIPFCGKVDAAEENTTTDNDIVKALECCKDADCLNCPRWTDEWHSGQCNDFLQDVLDLINRQKAEIERLRKHNTEMAHKHYNDGIKEFAERLKESAFACDVSFGFGREHCEEAVTVLEIDNLVKEMTEETRWPKKSTKC